MQMPKLDVMIVLFCYGGNGGVATILPDIATWLAKLNLDAGSDERIGRLGVKRAGDIPLSMERNRIVKEAKDNGFDVIVMIDSDNVPDLYYGHRSEAKQFFQSSFDFLYERNLRGLPTVVCAPYCGPPPHPVNKGEENVYVFYGVSDESEDKDPGMVGSIRFEAYSRDHAAIMRGIQPCAAGPTGCIMYSTSAFDLMPIHGMTDEEILQQHSSGAISTARAKQLLRMESWFFYEYTDQYQTRKASTEDVTNTREIQFAGIEKHGEPVVFCNWDAWAGHYKPKCVGAPQVLRIEQVSNVFAEAVRNNVSASEESVMLDFSDDGLQGPGHSEEVEEDVKEEGQARSVPPKQVISNGCCDSVKDLMMRLRAERVVIIGDRAGEVCRSVKSAKVDSVYAIGLSQASSVDGVKKINGLGTEPDEIALKLPPQDLDAVVIVNSSEISDLHEANRQWLRHLKSGGYLVVVSQYPMDEEYAQENMEFDGWQTMLSDRGDFCMIRMEVPQNVPDGV